MSFDVNSHLIKLPQKKRDKQTGQWTETYSDYLQVMWRLVWFREEKPNWTLETEAVNVSNDKAIFRCRIIDESGRVISTGHGSETPNDFNDYIEKAETKAVGRALAMLGYGTQFAPELDEGDRIVDTPVEASSQKQAKTNGNNSNTTKQNDSGQPSELEKRATAIYFYWCGGKEGQRHMSKEEYKAMVEGWAKEGHISTAYGKRWTQKDIEWLEARIEEDKELPF